MIYTDSSDLAGFLLLQGVAVAQCAALLAAGAAAGYALASASQAAGTGERCLAAGPPQGAFAGSENGGQVFRQYEYDTKWWGGGRDLRASPPDLLRLRP